MRTCTPGRHREPSIRATPAGRAAVVAAITAALLPVVAPVAEAAQISPAGPGHFDRADLRAMVQARADRAARGLYPPPPRHPAADALQVAVAPPLPVPPVQVATYRPRHQAPPQRVPKRSNAGSHYVPPPVSGSGSAVVAYAESFLGVRYQMNGASRSGIDCSGLVMVVYARFGIKLQHKASSFYGVGRPVSRADLQPGDILIMDGGGHAGIYVGNGLMIHAPHSGSHVQISPIWSFSAARRVL